MYTVRVNGMIIAKRIELTADDIRLFNKCTEISIEKVKEEK